MLKQDGERLTGDCMGNELTEDGRAMNGRLSVRGKGGRIDGRKH